MINVIGADVLNIISTFGFPAVVAFYLLVKTTDAINRNTAAINKLQASINLIVQGSVKNGNVH